MVWWAPAYRTRDHGGHAEEATEGVMNPRRDHGRRRLTPAPSA